MVYERIVVTGAKGFLGRYVLKALHSRGYRNIFTFSRKEFDLRKLSCVKGLLRSANPAVVIHLAGDVGGIGYNLDYPATLFYDNLIMGIQLMEEARKKGVRKLISIGTICAYPKFTPVPFKEENIWNGYPEETNAAYGLAKKMLLVQAEAYRKQYNFNAITLFPTNLYGPGDNFDARNSHVIPAIIRKCLQAIKKGDKEVILWGSGKPTRDFLYVEDAAGAIVMAMEKYDKPGPLNLGSGKEISIKELAFMVAKICGFKGKIVWDSSKPDGQPRRRLDISNAKKRIGFYPRVNFEDGLRKTIDWHRTHLIKNS